MTDATAMVHRNKHVELLYQDNGSDNVIVTFNGINTRADGKRFWGDAFLKKNGVSGLGVVSTRRNWFPREGMEEICAAARPILQKYRHITTYGTSMGAYGAIKYSRMLGAQTVVAFSPQHTLDPADKFVPPPFMVYYDAALHQDVTIQADDLAGDIFLFYDPFHLQDKYSAEYVGGLRPVNLISASFLGHATIQLIAKGNEGMEILRDCQAGDVRRVRDRVRDLRRRYGLRPYHLACYLVAKHPRLAFAVCEKYPDTLEESRLNCFCTELYFHGKTGLAVEWARGLAERDPANARLFKNLAGFHLYARDYSSAYEAITRALALEPDNYRHMLSCGKICQDAKKTDEAIYWGRRAVETHPRDVHTYVALFDLLRAGNANKEAGDLLRGALRLHPNNSSLLTRLESLPQS